jgi:hypothetical protein
VMRDVEKKTTSEFYCPTEPSPSFRLVNWSTIQCQSNAIR